MSARITEPSIALIRKALVTWQASLPKMIDQERTIDFGFALIQDQNTIWYELPKDSFLLLRQTVPGMHATVQIITRNGELIVDPARTREVLKDAMKEYQLVRLNAVIPTSLPWRDYKLLGFKHEGRIRKGVKFNGDWCDAEIMGALETEIGIPRRRRRKRSRKREEVSEVARAATEGEGTTGVTEEQVDATTESAESTA